MLQPQNDVHNNLDREPGEEIEIQTFNAVINFNISLNLHCTVCSESASLTRKTQVPTGYFWCIMYEMKIQTQRKRNNKQSVTISDTRLRRNSDKHDKHSK